MGCSLAWSLPRYFPFFLPFWIFLGPLFFVPRHERRGEIELHTTTIRETNGLSSCEKEKKGEERNYCFSMIDRIRYLASIIEELSVRRQRRSKVNWVTIAPLSSLEFHSRIWKRAEALKRSRNFLVPPWKLTFPPVIYDLIFISTLNFLFEIWFVFNVIRILFRCWWKLMINQFLIWLIFRNCCGRRK